MPPSLTLLARDENLTIKYKSLLNSLNQVGKQTWLIVSACVRSWEPKRDRKGHPTMYLYKRNRWKNRLCLQSDGFTQIDFEILRNGNLKVLSNTCVEKRFPEDAAFGHDRFQPGKVITRKTLMKYWRAYVEISNRRRKNYNIQFNPKTCQITEIG